MRTTNKCFTKQVQEHIIECLLDEQDLQNYEIPFKEDSTTLQKQLTTVLHEFNNFYGKHERKHYPNTATAFHSFLRGLPTPLTVEYTYYGISQTMQQWFENCGEVYKEKDNFTDIYYHLITREFSKLCIQNNVPTI